MEDLEAAINALVESKYAGSKVQFDHDPGYSKIIGTVVWDDFEGHSQSERQHDLWQVLRSGLDSDQIVRIGLLMTLTHAELDAILEEAA
jgi:hypothetical protein